MGLRDILDPFLNRRPSPCEVYITPKRGTRDILDPFLPVDHIVRGLHNAGLGNRGLSAAGENGSFGALRLLRMTEEIITAQDDRGSFVRCTLRAVDDRFYDRCYVNHVIFNS